MPIIRLGRITETPVPRAATTSTKSAPRVLRPKRRCAGAFRIIKAATRRGTHEPAGPGCLGDATGAGCCAGEPAGMRVLEFKPQFPFDAPKVTLTAIRPMYIPRPLVDLATPITDMAWCMGL